MLAFVSRKERRLSAGGHIFEIFKRNNAVKKIIASFGTLLLVACSGMGPISHADLQDQVFATERAFAKTMADRDFNTFAGFISDEAIFFSGAQANRGRDVITAKWHAFFTKPAAPFSWSPEHVEVLDSGTLALSTGPVLDADGKLVATFSSIWRREADGKWRIIFDKGNDVCQVCAAAP
jgi:ketosteroid isomerase-like protein